ncbi:MAG: hypothetical protein GY941_15685 [Planctomycetes bacterium]|nr:hypothetical protein [Planctomycetota bacterium]
MVAKLGLILLMVCMYFVIAKLAMCIPVPIIGQASQGVVVETVELNGIKSQVLNRY